MEQQNVNELSFAVDLTKEEYMQYYKVLTRYSAAAPMQRIGLIIVAALTVFGGAVTYQDGGFSALFTPDSLLLFIPAVLLLIYNLCVMPYFRKRQADRGYETAVAGGQIFAGTVTINREKITKITPSGTFTIYFSDRTLFHEQNDMQMFVNTQGRGIILPARCMTKELADGVRNIAFSALPPAFCKVREQMLCQRETPMEIEKPEEAAPSLFQTVVTYNEAEQTYIIQEITNRKLRRSIIPNSILSFLLALLFGMGQSRTTVLAIFVIAHVALTLLGYFRNKRGTKWIVSEENFRFDCKITEKAVIADGGARRGVYNVPWKDVEHVYESDLFVEICSKYHSIHIPKRLIADIDSFGRLMDTCRKERNR